MALPAALALTSIIDGAKKALSNKYVRIVLILLVLVFIFRKAVKGIVRKFRQSKFNKQEHKDVNQLAQQYRSASNPSGVSWMIDFDGSDEDAIEKLAFQTKGVLEEVAQAYRLKFEEALTDRLRKELSSDDFQNWRNIVT